VVHLGSRRYGFIIIRGRSVLTFLQQTLHLLLALQTRAKQLGDPGKQGLKRADFSKHFFDLSSMLQAERLYELVGYPTDHLFYITSKVQGSSCGADVISSSSPAEGVRELVSHAEGHLMCETPEVARQGIHIRL
jgi:hypothetical protein